MTETPRAIRPVSGGLILGDEYVPLLSGSVHYFRLARSAWRPALEELKHLGATLVDVYVPWAVHEIARGEYDFGTHDVRLDVAAFLRQASEVGLRAIVRPGPHINAELTGFGIPERVLWDERCQARSAHGNPVVLPFLPISFPVPSYASRAFYNEATLWLAAVSHELSELVWPNGPIVLAQIDNEGALYFRDSPYDQDYHPDAIEQYRRFLRSKWTKVAALRAAYGDEVVTFESAEPPKDFEGANLDGLARYLDWMEYQEVLVSLALYRFRNVLDRNGLVGTVTFHNLPVAETASPLDPARLERSVDFLALDYYHHASPETRAEIARRTTALRSRADAIGFPAFAAEMAAGFAPYFPPLEEVDNAFVAMTALAYGLQGMNVYMAVGRDRWIGGPIDSRGSPRGSADFWRRLMSAIRRTELPRLKPLVSVQIVVPRNIRRLARATHVFGPVPPAAFAFSGHQVERACLDEFGDQAESPALTAERFMRSLEQCLESLRIPYAYAAEDQIDTAAATCPWVVLVCAGALSTELIDRAARALMGGAALSVGPLMAERDDVFQSTTRRLPSPPNARVRLHLPVDLEELHGEVQTAKRELDLPSIGADPAAVQSTAFTDSSGKAKVLFAINPTRKRLKARLPALGSHEARDALYERRHLVEHGAIELDLPARTATMLELDPTS